MQKIIGLFVVLAVLVGGTYFYLQYSKKISGKNDVPVVQQEQATTTPVKQVAPQEVIGQSLQKRDIVAYHFGNGSKEIVFVGGIHGGYEWNTALVAYQLIDYLKANPSAVPAGEEITVIPVVNPDGLSKVVGTSSEFAAKDVNPSQSIQVAGRFNADTVDLNRNFDCDWQSQGTWQDKKVSGGNAAFSEPESAAIESYVMNNKPAAAVVYYSSAGGVYSSSCHNGILPETATLTDLYGKASGYPSHDVFDNYAVTGDMVNWLAKENIPAISVLLTNHTDTEWDKNLAGIQAVLDHFSTVKAAQ